MTKKTGFVDFDRRKFFRTTGTGLVASLGMSQAFAAGSKNASEADTVKENFVNSFCTDWNTRDVEKVTPYLSDTIEYHIWEGGPVINGIDVFRKQISGFMAGMEEINWEIHRSTAMGDIVINERTDHFIRGQGSKVPDDHFHVVGVFVVRQGKIQYWKDYGFKDTA